jgi:hypothetical protein
MNQNDPMNGDDQMPDDDDFETTYNILGKQVRRQASEDRRHGPVEYALPSLPGPLAPISNHDRRINALHSMQSPEGLHTYVDLNTGNVCQTTLTLNYEYAGLGFEADSDADAAPTWAAAADDIERHVNNLCPQAWTDDALFIRWELILRRVPGYPQCSPPGYIETLPADLKHVWYSIAYPAPDFLDLYTWPTVVATGERLDFHDLDVFTEHGHIDQALQFEPKPLQRTVPIRTLVQELRERR